MILIDVGNTNIVFAVSVNKKIKNIKRIGTNKEIKSFNNIVSKIIKLYLNLNCLKNSKTAIISSVVPTINSHIIKILKLHKIKVYVLKPKDMLPYFKIDYDLNEIGADRIANSVAVIDYKYK